MNKSELRAALKEIRRSLSISRRHEASLSLFHDLLSSFKKTQYILSFSSFSDEIDTSLINLYLARTGGLALPKIVGNTFKIFRVSNPHGHLIANSYGIFEPNPKLCQEIDPHFLDMILVPALGFDSNNHRLGYGLGFYDRFLQNIPNAQTIGIGFKEQLIDQIPSQDHDVPLQKVSLF